MNYRRQRVALPPYPFFAPDATRGVVRSVGPDDLEACGIRAVVANTHHLSQEPGADVVKAAGGLRKFMGWNGPILTDSGGFQIFSLLNAKGSGAKVSRDGFVYKASGGATKKLTAEKSIQLQAKLGGDIVVCLDYCTHPEMPAETQRESVDWTIRWAKTCKKTLGDLFPDDAERPMLLAVVQGGRDPQLRAECAERLLEIGFDGYGFGGWPIDERGELREEVIQVAELVRGRGALWGLGIGSPDNVALSHAAGYNIFDCVLPTRDARRGRLLIEPDEADAWRADPEEGAKATTQSRRQRYGYIYIEDEKHTRDDRPISGRCDCPTCARYSRAFLKHLFQIGDSLGHRLATMHNLRFYTRLVEGLAGEGREERPNGATAPPVG
jgi:queuine tRNA-ribosyltransferase